MVDNGGADEFCGTGVGVTAGGVERRDVKVYVDEKATGMVKVTFGPGMEEPVTDIDDEVFCASAGTSRRDPASAVAVAAMKPIFEESE